MPDVVAYLALGSNLGDRRALLDNAVVKLRASPATHAIRVSSYYETEPVGGPPGQAKYLNAVAEVCTSLDATAFFRILQAIETDLGRVRAERFGPRTIDIDLLLFGHAIVNTEDLIVPHPRMHERRFVLEPLAEIAPLAVHPQLQSTAKDLLEQLTQTIPSLELAGRNAVVTGSTSGIGRAIALALAQSGANVIVHGRRSEHAVQHAAAECKQSGVEALGLLADLRDEGQCGSFFERAVRRFSNLDIWINCAGADTLTGDAAKWTFERKLHELWAVDVRGTIQLSRAVGAHMKTYGRGVILNLGWDQAETGMEGDSGQLFGACKGAVMAFTKSLAIELAPTVRVNCLAPGWIRTAWGEHASETWQKRVLSETPLARWGTPEDVAAAACWLVSPAAQFITGQIIRINGGAVCG